MKKIGKKLCNFTKVFLVFCLLFSNLSSLKVVFAYEGEGEVETKEEEVIVEDTSEDVLAEEEKLVVSEEEFNEEIVDEENKEEIVQEEKNEIEEEEEILDEVSETRNLDEVNDEVSEELVEGETAPETGEEETVTYDFTTALNDSASVLGLADKYLFSEDNKLYVVVGVNENEVFDIVNNAYSDITTSIVEDSVTLTATNGDSITYQVVVYDNDFLNRLMKVAVGNGEAGEDDDINGDGVVDTYDAATLWLILNYGLGCEVFNEDVTIDAKLDGDTDSLTVGDTFTIRYIMTLADYGVNGITGLINYNKDMLSLDKVDVKNFTDGANYDGKFLYFGDYIMGEEVVTVDPETGDEEVTYSPKDYIIVEMTFTALSGGSDAVTVSDIGYFNDVVYYSGNETLSKDVTIISNNNTLSSLTIGGVSVPIDSLTNFYTITVPNDVTNVDLSYVLSDLSASVTSIVAPEELAVGENTVTITVKAENGEERTYTITVIREGEEEEDTEVVSPVGYEEAPTYEEDDTNKEEITTDGAEEKKEEKNDESKLSRVIIIILILLAIAGLIYLIFKDDDDDETKKANKDINKFKKEDFGDTKSKKINNDKKIHKKGR